MTKISKLAFSCKWGLDECGNGGNLTHKKACFSFIGWIHFGTKGYIRHQKWLYQFTDYKRNGKFISYTNKPSQKLLATQVFSTFFVTNNYFWIVFKTNESDRTVYSNLKSFFSAVLSHIKRAAAEARQFLEICCDSLETRLIWFSLAFWS